MIKHVASNSSVIGIKITNIDSSQICFGCAFDKTYMAPFPRNIIQNHVSSLKMLLHSYIYRPISVPSHGCSLYNILFQDNCIQ